MGTRWRSLSAQLAHARQARITGQRLDPAGESISLILDFINIVRGPPLEPADVWAVRPHGVDPEWFKAALRPSLPFPELLELSLSCITTAHDFARPARSALGRHGRGVQRSAVVQRGIGR